MNNKIENLFEWIQDNEGFIHPNVQINSEEKLIINEILGAEGVHLFSIPTKLRLDYGIYKDYLPPLYNLLTQEEKDIFELPFFKLILNLVNEKLKGNKSFYKPFINTFPLMKDLSKELPIFIYTDRKEEWFKILPTVITKLDDLNNFYVQLYLLIVKLKTFDTINPKSFKGFSSQEEILKVVILWAFLIVNSYAVENSYLLPLYNLMNFTHDTKNIVVKDSQNRINFSFHDIQTLNLNINNGVLDNETLFTFHGYINETEKKYLEVKLGDEYIIENEVVKEFVDNVFKTIFDKSKQKYYITQDTPSISLVQYLRILSLNEQDIKFIKENDKKFFMRFISMDNEANVYKKLLKIVKTKYNFIKNYIDEENETDVKDIKTLKKIVKEQKEILKNMYYEIHKKWLMIMDTPINDEQSNHLKLVFKIDNE